MNIRHLKIFITVCEEGSMTRAAKLLFMAQPSVSQAIKELEDEYQVRFFERLNHHLYLTAAGERMRFYAQHMINLSDQVRQELADLGNKGTIRVGASLTIGAYLLPGLVAAFQKNAPGFEVFSRVDNTGFIEKLLLEDQLDLGLVEGPVHSAHIVEEFLCNDAAVFIASPLHPFARKGRLKIQDLAGQTFVIREAGSGMQSMFENVMEEAAIPWKNAGVFNNNEAILQAVRANLGLAMISNIAVTDDHYSGKIVPLEVEGITIKRKFNLVYHRQKTFTRAMQAFAEAVRRQIKKDPNFEDCR